MKDSNMRQRLPSLARSNLNNPDTDISEDASLLQKAKKRVLLLFDDLPEWAKDNENIMSGWRSETESYLECLKSMGYIHNETGNIYTHLFAAIWMMILGSWWSLYAGERYPAMDIDDGIVFFLFFLGGIICFLLSTIYHVLSNHSHTTHIFCLKLDFLGILIVTAGCLPPCIWYTFPCASSHTKFTWICVSLSLGQSSKYTTAAKMFRVILLLNFLLRSSLCSQKHSKHEICRPGGVLFSLSWLLQPFIQSSSRPFKLVGCVLMLSTALHYMPGQYLSICLLLLFML